MNTLLKKYSQEVITLLLLIFITNTNAQLSSGNNNPNNKFLGNVINGYIPSDFLDYWDQVTPENPGKWGAVEGTRDVMNWNNMTSIYNYANTNNIPAKQHTFVWGSQEPSWVSGLSESEQLAEATEWIELFADEFSNVQMIDVVNEALHAEPSYKNALTNAYRAAHPAEVDNYYDWVLWAFEKARAEFPTAILMINDYGIINDPNAISDYLEIINLVKAKGWIDAIGIQCHEFNINTMSANQVINNLNLLTAANLPIYVSELDISGTAQQQLQRYQTLFPAFWEHNNVAGVTLWGYITGETWKDGTGLVENGIENASMQWLKQYMQYDNGNSSNDNITIRARGTDGTETVEIRIDNITVSSYTLTTSFTNYTASGNGTVSFHYTNDDTNRDVIVDYAIIDGITNQAEDQVINTGAWDNTNSSCGFSLSENLHCNGYIEFLQNALKTKDFNTDFFKLFPNPTNDGEFNIQLSKSSNGSINIFDLSGKRVFEKKFANQQKIKASTLLSNGLYLVQIKSENYNETKKLIIN